MSRTVIAPRHRLRAAAIPMTRRLVTVVCGAVALLALGTAAMAFWSAGWGGSGSASSGSMSAPTNVFASSPGGDTVAVSWEAATLGNGQPVDGYYVTRVKDSDGTSSAACGTSDSSPTTSLSCDDLAVADGNYHYTVTAQHGSWTATSAASVSVNVTAGRPTVTVTSISPTPNANGYNNTTPVVVNLSASDASGIASITYRINAGAPVTVAAATAAVSVPGNGIHTVTFSAKDNTGVDSLDQYQTVRIDTVLPGGSAGTHADRRQRHWFLQHRPDQQRQHPHVLPGLRKPEAPSRCTAAGSQWARPSSAADGTYTVTASALTAGTKTITVRNTDLAGNLGPASPTTTMTLDYTAPSHSDLSDT